MKKFFRDVIGEMREPSEDAGKVLDVIRRVVRVALLLTAIGLLIGLIMGAVNILMMYKQGYLDMQLEYGQESAFQFFLPYGKSFFKVVIYFVLFGLSNKYIRKGTINKALLIVMLALVIAMQLTGFNFELSRIIPSILELIVSIAYCAIIYFAFNGNDKTDDSELDTGKITVHNIAISGYVLLITSIIRQITLPIVIYSYIKYLVEIIKCGDAYIWGWIYAISLTVQGIVFVSFIVILILSLLGRKMPLNRVREKANLHIVLFFVALVGYMIGYFFLSGDYLYIIVFAIAVSYQNKYKVFDYTHKRIFAKIKIAVDNYMHIGRD